MRKQLESEDIISLYFDGRIDLTKTKIGTKIKEEHITLISEPCSKYVGHVVPCSSTSQEIYNSIISKLGNLSKLMLVGCDGAAVNTGRNAGIIRKLE